MSKKLKKGIGITTAFLLLYITLQFVDSLMDDFSHKNRFDHVRFRGSTVGLLLILLTLVLGIIFYFVHNYLKKKEMEELAFKMSEIFRQEQDEVTGNAILDRELLKIKNTISENERLIEMETIRTKDLIIYLAHDLKTPLASVVGYLNLLNDLVDLPVKKQQKFLNIALNKAERLENMLDEFFEITRFSLYNMVLYKNKIDIVILVQQLIEEFYPLSQQKEQKIIYQGPESLFIAVDGEKMARAVNNLLKNAYIYGNSHSTITVALKIEENEVELSITNEGVTIPEEQLRLIFEKFYRLDQSRSTQTGGAGLGLAIAKEIVEAHQGKISAHSQNYKTTFTIILPIS